MRERDWGLRSLLLPGMAERCREGDEDERM